MKNLLLSFGTTLFFLLASFSVNSQNANNNNDLVGKARGAAANCLNDYYSQGIPVTANVETTGICFVSGELHKVSFYTTVRCHQQPCPRPYSVLVATVYFDCDNNVTLVECGK